MQFLYPTSRQFPFDCVCESIVRSLEERNWHVPGINVEFYKYGSGAQKFSTVSYIKSKDFKLLFGRVQRTMPGGRWNDTAAVTGIVIPTKELHVYDDESGPTFYLYVGNNWETDREKFMNGSKVNSKLNGKPKMYLQYKGGCDCRATDGASFEAVSFLMAHLTGDAAALARMYHTHSGRRPPVLIHTNDLNREFDPEGDEPKVFKTAEVMDEFRKYLADVVMKTISSYPIPAEKIDMLIPPTPTSFPDSIGPLFCFGDYRQAERINQGRKNPDKLEPADRYGLSGNGHRLMWLNIANDGSVPEIAYEGFLWCGIGNVTTKTKIESLEIPGHERYSDQERFVIRVTPNRANEIYIADQAQYGERRKELKDDLNGRDHFTDAEVADFNRARARTIIPINKYQQGMYKKPIVLIGRELSFDEVEVVSGPHKSSLDY